MYWSKHEPQVLYWGYVCNSVLAVTGVDVWDGCKWRSTGGSKIEATWSLVQDRFLCFSDCSVEITSVNQFEAQFNCVACCFANCDAVCLGYGFCILTVALPVKNASVDRTWGSGVRVASTVDFLVGSPKRKLSSVPMTSQSCSSYPAREEEFFQV